MTTDGSGLQSRIPKVETVLFGLMVLTVTGLGLNTLAKGYAVLANGASAEPFNDASRCLSQVSF